MMQINVQKLSENAKIPERATSGSAGYDLFAAQSKVIPARGRDCILTDIKVSVLLRCKESSIASISA